MPNSIPTWILLITIVNFFFSFVGLGTLSSVPKANVREKNFFRRLGLLMTFCHAECDVFAGLFVICFSFVSFHPFTSSACVSRMIYFSLYVALSSQQLCIYEMFFSDVLRAGNFFSFPTMSVAYLLLQSHQPSS